MYKNGTYANTITYSRGVFNVSLIVSGGKITNVQFTDTSGSGTSQQINAGAFPILKTETISSQSASVNTVSGATLTSNAYRAWLTTTLASAKV